jgi:hypothetical protein
LIHIPLNIFSALESVWNKNITPKIISSILIFSFLVGISISWLSQVTSGYDFLVHFKSNNYFLAVDISFTLLLVFEILGLVFVLPKSVADAVGKQMEIVSIILLRSAFKEFGSFQQPIDWSNVLYDPLYHMLADGFGALIIFFIVGVYYKKQEHERITYNDEEQSNFIKFKKLLAFIMLMIFIYLGASDVFNLINNGKYEASFNTFYTVLIFTDILILLYSLRYSTRYSSLFRYSSFALIAVLIRFSLTAPPYVNVIIAIASGLFLLGLTSIYNYFRRTGNVDD